MSTVLEELITVFKANGYVVNVNPLEKSLLSYKEVLITMNDVDVDVESLSSYKMDVTLSIGWQEQDINKIIEGIVTIIQLIEEGLVINKTVKFIKPKVELFGTLYIVTLLYKYSNIISINNI